jgi:hypothetical protein
MIPKQKNRDYLPYCKLCLLYGKCDGPEILKTDNLPGDWEGIKETSCRKFVPAKPAGELTP